MTDTQKAAAEYLKEMAVKPKTRVVILSPLMRPAGFGGVAGFDNSAGDGDIEESDYGHSELDGQGYGIHDVDIKSVYYGSIHKYGQSEADGSGHGLICGEADGLGKSLETHRKRGTAWEKCSI